MMSSSNEKGKFAQLVFRFLVALSFAASIAPAQEDTAAPGEPAPASAAESPTGPASLTSEQARSERQIFLRGVYSYIDLILPGKYGFSLGYNHGADAVTEFEYIRATVKIPFIVEDLGSFTEQRFSLQRRSFFGNSFSMLYGVAYNTIDIELGDAMLAQISDGSIPFLKLVEVDTLGANIGIGNQWIVWRGLNVGCDWISWSQPMYITKKSAPILTANASEDDKRRIDNTLNAMAYLPRISILKFQIGWAF